MKMVFFSSDRLEVELLSKELAQAGIPCQVREGIAMEDLPAPGPETELWIQNDRDAHRAFLLCVEREAGFAKRDTPALTFDDLFPELEPLNKELAA